jgi:hypothetical protein
VPRVVSSNRSLSMRRPPLCHPERTRISYYAAPKMTSFAAFIKESRMSFAEPTGLNRKSGAAEGSAVPRGPFLEMFFDRANPEIRGSAVERPAVQQFSD